MDTKISFISIQATYAHVDIALFYNNQCIDTVNHQDIRASSHLILYLETLLKQHNMMLSDLAFIAIDKGPGAFTSLRVAIATVNGIAFAHTIPLMGIDGLEALLYQAHSIIQNKKNVPTPYVIVALLNAYNNDVYYAIEANVSTPNVDMSPLKIPEKGCLNIDLLLHEIKNSFTDIPLFFTGNGAYLHQTLINSLRESHIIPEQTTSTAHSIGTLAYQQYIKNPTVISYKIEPNYMKSQLFAIRNPAKIQGSE